MVLREHASSQLRVELRDLRLCCSKVHAEPETEYLTPPIA